MTAPASEPLRERPFCGGPGSSCGRADEFVTCDECQAVDEGPCVLTAKWNTRPLESSLRLALDAERGKVEALEKHLAGIPCKACGRYYVVPFVGADPKEAVASQIAALEQRNRELVDLIHEDGCTYEFCTGDYHVAGCPVDTLTPAELSAARARGGEGAEPE